MANWEGVEGSPCEHRTCGGRAWCLTCTEWCYELPRDFWCHGCLGVVPPRPVLTIDPAVNFGEVSITGVRAEVLAEMVVTGDSVESVTEGYGLSRDQVLLCCWWEVERIMRKRTRRSRRDQRVMDAWWYWLATFNALCALDRWADIPDPPKVPK